MYIKNIHPLNTYTLSITAIVLLAYCIIVQPSAIADVLAAIAFIVIVYFFDRKYYFPFEVIIFLLIAILLNPIGVFGLYSKFVFFDIGYDKLIHLFSGFAIAHGMMHIVSTKSRISKYATIILIVLGLGVLMEISEFIGTRYFGIDKGGIFAIGDTLPEIRSDLQRYDIYFDFIFNLAGAIVATLINFIRNPKNQKKNKNKFLRNV